MEGLPTTVAALTGKGTGAAVGAAALAVGAGSTALAIAVTSVAAWGALTLGAAVGMGAALATALAGALAAGLVATGWGCFSARYLGLSPFQLALSLLKRRRASASVMRPASAALGSRMRDPTRMWLMLPSAKLRGFLS
ncbi:hypothetical protein D3C72_1472140 [compost metagenome]